MAPESTSTIPLSPIATEHGEERLAAIGPAQSRLGLLDWLLFITTCSLGFLLASTPARNSDLWLHLAGGRSVAEGQPWGIDPFTYTAGGVYWVNHSWLSDWLLYRLYLAGGGSALVIAKCVLATAIAALFFCFRCRGTGMGGAAFAASFALVAAGQWLLLQPFLFSLLGIIVTLWLLERPRLVAEPRVAQARRLRWLLLPLFALWANLDGWFLLGPIMVGLYTLGEALSSVASKRSRGRNETAMLASLTLVGFAACLLTPYHYHVFSLPTPLGLTPAEQAWRYDPAGRNHVISPFARPLATALAFSGPGGWAYCTLLAAGVFSFVLCRRYLRVSRLLTWLAFATLSFYQARTISFFAMAAGPLLALNLNDWLFQIRNAESADSRPRVPDYFLSILRSAVFAAGLALLIFAWPGWLQPKPYQVRGWSVEPDGSMVRLAARLQAHHADRNVGNFLRILNFSPDAAHYLAWFCPEEKGYVDSRWPLFSRSAATYVVMRKSLLDGNPLSPQQFRLWIENDGINCILLYDPDGERMTRAFRRLLQDTEEWELLELEGSAALFGRVSLVPPFRRISHVPPSWKPFDPRREAYHPEAARLAPTTTPRAPRAPEPWYEFFLQPETDSRVFRRPDTRNPDRAEAALLMVCFEEMRGRYREDSLNRWRMLQAAALVGIGAKSDAAASLSDVLMRVGFSVFPVGAPQVPKIPVPKNWEQIQDGPGGGIVWQTPWNPDELTAFFLVPHDCGPFEWLLLSVRSARRAIATNPDDAGAYIALAEAYRLLDQEMAGLGWLTALPELAALRRTQIVTALEQAALLRPELDEPHALLVQIYYGEGQLDRALEHLRDRLRIAEQDAKKHGPETKGAVDREHTLQSDVKNLETVVRRSQEIYEANSKSQSDPSQVLVRAKLAARHGLSRQALEMLLASNFAIFGRDGAEMQLDLMLGAGRALQVFEWLEPAHQSVLGFQKYHMVRARAAAACGDYATADLELAKLDSALDRIEIAPRFSMPVNSALAVHAADAALTYLPGCDPVSLTTGSFWRNYYLRILQVKPMADRLRERADLHVVRGLLSVESGDTERAGREFRTALAVWGEQGHAESGSGLDFFSRPIAQEMLRRLEAPR